jgi:predicted permease
MNQDRWRRYLRFFGRNVEADVDDELRFHLESRIADFEAAGMTRDEAERAARERFGNYEQIDAALRAHDYALARTERRRNLVDDLKQDLRYALRSLRRAPGFAIVAIATLALGIGANTAVFSVVDAVVVRSLPYPEPEQLTFLWGNTLGEYTRLRELNRSWTDIAAYRPTSINLAGDGEPERLDGALATPSLFSSLRVAAARGHTYTEAEVPSSGMSAALLSDGLWRRRFGADAAIVGKKIMVEGAPYTVVGVMPPDFGFPTRDVQMWIPVNMPPARSGALWGNGGWRFLGRLKPGVTPVQAQAELKSLYKQLRHENPVWDPGPEYGDAATVTPLQQQLVGSARTMLFLLLGVVAVVLLIACVNVANLLLVRATARQKEVAIRMAIGGGRGRIIRQFLTESIVLAFVGGVCGVFVAWLGVRELIALLPSDIPRVIDVGIDLRVLVFTAVLVVATGFAFGLLPALRAGRDVQPTLRAGARSATGSNRKLASLLVSGEIAAAVLLLIGASLLIRSAIAMQRTDPGFAIERTVTAGVTPPRLTYKDPAKTVAMYENLLQQVSAIPGVQAAAVVDRLPLGRSIAGGLAVRVEGQAEDLTKSLPMVSHYQVTSANYLATMNIPLVSGRAFTLQDRAGTPQVALISESVAKRFWPKGDAIGKRMGYPYPSEMFTIVGIVKDVKLDSLAGTDNEVLYRPLGQANALNMAVVARTTIDPAAFAVDLRRAVSSVDRNLPLSELQTMRTVVDRSSARQRFATLLLTIFAGVALVLGLVGIYGVMSYAVAQRQREIGIRMALGASPSNARSMVLREGLSMAGSGIVLGLFAAALGSRLLGGLLFGVGRNDPLTFVLVPVSLAGVALLASYIPARRATRVDPTTALRAD